jgi:uncharacterized OB-fold protein
MRTGTVYTETVVHLAPTRFAADAPYQVAIVTLENGERLTARVAGERVAVDDPVVETKPVETESHADIPFFRKS